jgi:hypothetical protein
MSEQQSIPVRPPHSNTKKTSLRQPAKEMLADSTFANHLRGESTARAGLGLVKRHVAGLQDPIQATPNFLL